MMRRLVQWPRLAAAAALLLIAVFVFFVPLHGGSKGTTAQRPGISRLAASDDYNSIGANLFPCAAQTGTLAGLSFGPGTYCFPAAATLTGTVTLTGSGPWLFEIGTGGTGALTATSLTVVGGNPCNVRWWVKQAVTLTTTTFQGTILAGGDITFTGTSLTGPTPWSTTGVTSMTTSNVLGCTTAAVAGPAGPTSPSASALLVTAILNAIPPPADNPLLDANGNVVLDASGKPVSDTAEQFHAVIPHDFDPGHTYLVEGGWLDGLGCVTNGIIAIPNATFTGVGSTTSYSNAACPTGDTRDTHNAGLLMVKTGPTNNFASEEAELKKVRGITLTELGYDIRKAVGQLSPNGSHCGAGAPRFDVITSDGVDHFVGDCNMAAPLAAPTVMSASTDWIRLRWGPAQLAAAFPPISPSAVVQRIVIVFDEGSDTGPDFFGAAILDNIDVNGQLVGRGGM